MSQSTNSFIRHGCGRTTLIYPAVVNTTAIRPKPATNTASGLPSVVRTVSGFVSRLKKSSTTETVPTGAAISAHRDLSAYISWTFSASSPATECNSDARPERALIALSMAALHNIWQNFAIALGQDRIRMRAHPNPSRGDLPSSGSSCARVLPWWIGSTQTNTPLAASRSRFTSSAKLSSYTTGRASMPASASASKTRSAPFKNWVRRGRGVK